MIYYTIYEKGIAGTGEASTISYFRGFGLYLDNVGTSIAIHFLHFPAYFKGILKWKILSSFLHGTISATINDKTQALQKEKPNQRLKDT